VGKEKLPFSAEEIVKIFSEKLMPYEGDPLMLDYSTKNMYSEHIVKLVAWHRHYTRFWLESSCFATGYGRYSSPPTVPTNQARRRKASPSSSMPSPERKRVLPTAWRLDED
jgi:hypothetical protein